MTSSTATPESTRLRALALELYPSLTKPGDCVALTGSAARGNATAASNLDLWVIGPGPARALTKVVHGVSVTVRRPSTPMRRLTPAFRLDAKN